ncbi:MAG: hypothetical protein WCW31_06095 [Patescibacteria group bacterium]|jgi:hypothetical protein
MKISTCLHTFVVVCLFCLIGCSSSDPPGNEGAGANGSGIGPQGKKPTAIQDGCTDEQMSGCDRYTYNSHGDPEKIEGCAVSCQKWCNQPFTTLLAYEYDQQGRIAKATIYNPPEGSAPVCFNFTYDGRSNWIERRLCAPHEGQEDECRELTYDAQGRIQIEFRFDCETKEGLGCAKYSYDNQNRIVQLKWSDSICSVDPAHCTNSVYEGDTVTDYQGDGKCENLGKGWCKLYFY